MKKKSKFFSSVLISGLFLFIAFGSGDKEEKKQQSNSNEIFCNKEFYANRSVENIGMDKKNTTIFNCDGTYTSKQEWEADSRVKEDYDSYGRSHDTNYNFSGSWEVVTNVPEEIKRVLTGFKDGDYTLIKYKSNSGKERYAYISPYENQLYLSLVILPSDNIVDKVYHEENYDLLEGSAVINSLLD